MMRTRQAVRLLVAAFACATAGAAPAHAQLSRVYEQFYLPADHNWAFRNNYPAADRLFNAFDYGHAILYEILWTRPNAPESELEEDRYDFITKKLLVKPPRMPLEESAVEVAYARLAPEAKVMFDWAHLLHRQIYDVWADESIEENEKDARIAELLLYYKSRPDLAFSSKPKNMDLMEGRFYSKEFRNRYPKFNGLIWAYHWLQVGLYEPLVTARSQAERQTNVIGVVTRFREMLENPPAAMPTVMPMTAAIAPEFTRRYPEAAIIFDNLHGMHDVISDILSSPKVARRDKRKEILEAARLYRDNSSFVMTEREWLDMSIAMGIQHMGGPAVAASAPMENVAPTDEPSAAHRDHTANAQEQPAAESAPERSEELSQLLQAMFADPVIRSRLEQDTALVRLMRTNDLTLPHVHPPTREDTDSTTDQSARRPAAPAAAKPARKKAVVTRTTTAPKPVAKPPVRHPAGHTKH